MTHKGRKTEKIKEERMTHPELVNRDLAVSALLMANNDRREAYSKYVGLYRETYPQDFGLSELKINNFDLQAWYDKAMAV